VFFALIILTFTKRTNIYLYKDGYIIHQDNISNQSLIYSKKSYYLIKYIKYLKVYLNHNIEKQKKYKE